MGLDGGGWYVREDTWLDKHPAVETILKWLCAAVVAAISIATIIGFFWGMAWVVENRAVWLMWGTGGILALLIVWFVKWLLFD